jgi:starch synthase
MRIIHVAAEVAPVAKIGGLGDVVYGLSRETRRKGHPTSVLIPKYDILELDEIEDLACINDHFTSTFGGKEWNNSIWKGTVGDLKVYFLESHHPARFFNRGCIYGCDDDIDRFLYFAKAALTFIKEKNSFDVIHTHDWQTAILGPLADIERKANTFIPPILLTIHNMDYQGRCAPWSISQIGLNVNDYYSPDCMQDSLYPEALNLLKGGIIYSDFITTVSPTYCNETKETELGEGLEKILNKNQEKYRGILNGIDFDYWNPKTDKYLPFHFSIENQSNSNPNLTSLDNKRKVKSTLRERLKLEDDHRPVVGVISRLVPQKGVEVIKHSIKSVVENGGQFVLLGSSPIPRLHDEFHRLKKDYENHPHISLNLQHQEQLAHQIFTGSDIFIVPSNFEPCGLTQMIALRYGTIPIVRSTGGLKDSVYDADNDNPDPEKGIGYTFLEPTNEAFDQALLRAITCWRQEPDKWKKMIIEGMKQDFSWRKSAEEYLELYHKIFYSSK